MILNGHFKYCVDCFPFHCIMNAWLCWMMQKRAFVSTGSFSVVAQGFYNVAFITFCTKRGQERGIYTRIYVMMGAFVYSSWIVVGTWRMWQFNHKQIIYKELQINRYIIRLLIGTYDNLYTHYLIHCYFGMSHSFRIKLRSLMVLHLIMPNYIILLF